MIDVRPQKPLVNASSATTASASATDPANLATFTNGLYEPESSGQDQGIHQTNIALVYRQFEQQAAQRPEKTAIHFSGQQLSYGELNSRANRLARHLQTLGAGPDVLIAVYLERSLELMVTLLAIHKAGSAYLPLDLGYPRDRIQYILDNAQASLLICSGNPALPESQAQIVNLAQLPQQFEQLSDQNLETSPNCRDLAYVIYTSGSTGKPKGVQIEHRSLSNLIESMAQTPGLTAEDVTLAITTVCFDISILELFMPLATGATMVLVSREIASDGLLLRQVLEQQPITWAQATPSTWRLLIASGWQGNSTIRLLSGGEATTLDLAEQLLERSAEIWNVYGPTETTIWSMVHRIMPGDNSVPLGKAIQRTQVYLMEQLPNGELYPCGPEQPGEICIGGWGVARGYVDRPELNREKFVADLSSQDLGARLYRTGDLGQELADGSIQFLGRADHQVKIRGHRVELGEVEAAILKHERVQNAAVISTTDPSGSQQLAGYLVLKAELLSTNTPSPSSSGSAASTSARQPHALATEQVVVEQWQTLWDDAYRNSAPETDPTFDFSGYGDSYTGALLPGATVKEWTKRTVERILALKPQRVLEVGCGKGLLLFRIAPECDRYVGTDVTPAAIAHLSQHLAQSSEPWPHVSLAQAAAHELKQLALLAGEQFDTIVINSVVQYFPDADYLLNVLVDLAQLLEPGGRIFLGDIRNADLLETFHTSLLLHQQQQLPPVQRLSVGEIWQKVQQKSKGDVELLLAPPFFSQLQQRCPRITQVVTQLKRGRDRNELNDFRYDAVLHLDQPDLTPLQVQWESWGDWHPGNEPRHELGNGLLEQIQQRLLAQPGQPPYWGLRNIPNTRVSTSQHQLQQLQNEDWTPLTEALLTAIPNHPGLDPEDLWQLAQDCHYQVHLNWSQSRGQGTFDAVFYPVDEAQPAADWASPLLAEPWEIDGIYESVLHEPNAQKTSPVAEQSESQLLPNRLAIPELQQFLKQQLPEYMLPSQFVFLEQLPLTLNGKVDRKALPPLSTAVEAACAIDGELPITPTEIQLAGIWEQLLNISPVSRTTHFFEAGGHSLLAAQLVSRIRNQFLRQLRLSHLFQNSTLAQLAEAIDQLQQVEGLEQSKGSAPTLTQKKQASPDLAQQIEADLALSKDIHLPSDLAPRSDTLNHVLLTGATGFVGGFLLQELLLQTQAQIHCLVRAPSLAEAQRKLENHLERCGVAWEQYRDRIRSIPGDLSQPRLGLSPEQFHQLQHQIDAIYHNGAYVNLIYPYSELRGSNVNSTIELLHLASQGKLKALHYVSTLDVLNPEAQVPNQTLREDQALPHWSQLSSHYAYTKWVSEQLISAARAKGIPCNIYRLGMTTGHSQHGFSNPTDMVGRLIQGLVELKAAPQEDFPIHLAPVDIVCQAIAALGQPTSSPTKHHNRSSHPQGKNFHLSNPVPISFQTLVQSLRDSGYALDSVPYEDWFAQLMDSSEDNALRSLLANGLEQKPGPAQLKQGSSSRGPSSSDSSQRSQAERDSIEQSKAFFNVLDLHQVSTASVEAALPQLSWPNSPDQLISQYIHFFRDCGALARPTQVSAETAS